VTFEARLREVSDAIARGDWEALPGMLSDRFFEYSPHDDEPTASARIVEALSNLKRALPDLVVAFSNPLPDGDLLRATLSMTGTHSNPLWGSPGSGNPITWANPVTIKLIDDRIAIRFDDVAFPDLVQVLRQLELVNPADQMDKPPVHPIAIPEFALKVLMTGQAGDVECTHLDQIRVTEPATRMCAGCFSEGTSWPALRMCLTCGFVGCCDMSKNKHMKQHHEETGHPLMRSVNMDEGWVWCYVDSAFFEKGLLARYPV
jgi:predicted ester cyclase